MKKSRSSASYLLIPSSSAWKNGTSLKLCSYMQIKRLTVSEDSLQAIKNMKGQRAPKNSQWYDLVDEDRSLTSSLGNIYFIHPEEDSLLFLSGFMVSKIWIGPNLASSSCYSNECLQKSKVQNKGANILKKYPMNPSTKQTLKQQLPPNCLFQLAYQNYESTTVLLLSLWKLESHGINMSNRSTSNSILICTRFSTTYYTHLDSRNAVY